MSIHQNGQAEKPVAEGLYTYESFQGGGGKRSQKPRSRHFLWWCAGAYQDLLKDCPSEQTKYAGLGGVLLATFILASLSAGYAIYSVFSNPFWAVVFALIWGLVIFNFDRFLVATMRKYGVSRTRQIWMAMPRVVLALLIGFTIARPLELKIFEKEIDVQIAENRHHKILLNDSLLAVEDNALLSVARMEQGRLLARQAHLEDTLRQLQQAYVQEADGTGGSRQRGIAGLTKLKREAYESSLRQYTPELADIDRQLRFQDSLVKATGAAREEKRRQYEARVTADVGFLERNKALSDLSSREGSVFWANFLIGLLIILIETGPILSKLIMQVGPYDLALARYELAQMAQSESELRRDKELVMDKRQEVYARKKEVSRELIDKLTALQKQHIQEELDQWEAGKEASVSRVPLEEAARKIKERYDYGEEHVL